MNRYNMILATFLFLFVVAGISFAGTTNGVTFSWNFTCVDPCGGSNLTLASYPGLHASDSVNVGTVSSTVPGFGPFALNGAGSQGGGVLAFTSAGAYQVLCNEPTACSSWYPGQTPPGPYITINGGADGLPNNTTLLQGYFLWQGMGGFHPDGRADFQSPLYVTYMNPTLLADLGMPGAENYGMGYLKDSFVPDFQTGGAAWSVELDFAPSPEPSSLVLFGSGILALGGLLRKRLLP